MVAANSAAFEKAIDRGSMVVKSRAVELPALRFKGKCDLTRRTRGKPQPAFKVFPYSGFAAHTPGGSYTIVSTR